MAPTKRPTWGDAAERDRDVFGQIIGQTEDPDPEPEVLAPPAVEPRPEPVVAAAPPAPPVVAPRQAAPVEASSTTPPVKRGRGRPRKAVASPSQAVQITIPTGRHIEPTHSLNVRLPQSVWLPFRSVCGSQIRDMTEVITAMVDAFNADPMRWLALIDVTRENGVAIGDLLTPAVAAVLEGFTEDD